MDLELSDRGRSGESKSIERRLLVLVLGFTGDFFHLNKENKEK